MYNKSPAVTAEGSYHTKHSLSNTLPNYAFLLITKHWLKLIIIFINIYLVGGNLVFISELPVILNVYVQRVNVNLNLSFVYCTS